MKLLHRNSLSVFWSSVSLAVMLVALAASSICASALAIMVGDQKTTTSSEAGTAGQDGKIAHVGPGITAPRPISTPDPEYPKAARDAKLKGTVQLRCVIGTDGTVSDVRITKSAAHDLDESSKAAVQRWKFSPALKAGKPIAVEVSIETNFQLYPDKDKELDQLKPQDK